MSPRGEQSLGCHGAGWWRFKPAAALEALELDGLLVGAGLGVLLHVDDIVGEGDAEARLLQHGVDGVDGVDGLDGVRGGPHETEPRVEELYPPTTGMCLLISGVH